MLETYIYPTLECHESLNRRRGLETFFAHIIDATLPPLNDTSFIPLITYEDVFAVVKIYRRLPDAETTFIFPVLKKVVDNLA